MNYFVKLIVVLSSMLGGSAQAKEGSCAEHCTTPFGTFLGQSFLTKAYSNCNALCVKAEDNLMTLHQNQQSLVTGMKWQCVEYARRWLIDNKGMTFADVQYAYHIWDLKFAENITTHQHFAFLRYQNKVSKEAPQVGDLLIYGVDLAVTGHVAVIVGVDEDTITIAEQNYFNRPWEGSDYARRLLLDKDEKGRYRIFDDSLIGWVRIGMS